MAHRVSICVGFLPDGTPEVLYCGADASASLAAAEAASEAGKYESAAHFRNPEPDKVKRFEVVAVAAAEAGKKAAEEAEAAKKAAEEAKQKKSAKAGD